MMYNFTVQCPDCISLIDANDFFGSMIVAIQDLELEIACMQHEMITLCKPDDAKQQQIFKPCSYLPDLVKDPALGELLAFNNISIEEWQESVEQHLQELEDCTNGNQVVATDII